MDFQVLDNEIKFLEENPDLHRQECWILVTNQAECGTAGCLAGWLALHNGWEVVDRDWGRHCYVQRGGQELSVPAVARKLLDATSDEAGRLFNQDNTLADIKALRNRYAAEEGL